MVLNQWKCSCSLKKLSLRRQCDEWVGIVDQNIIKPFKVDVSVKLNNANYCHFMDKNLFECYKTHPRSFKAVCVYMHDNDPSHISKLTREFFERKIFTGEKIIEWPPSYPHRKPMIVKKESYECGKRNMTKRRTMEASKTTMSRNEIDDWQKYNNING